MITLQSQADKIANLLKQPDNHELKERIKESFKNLMATRIRQSFEKHGIDEALLLPFEVELIDAKYPEARFHEEGIEVKRSKYKIPTPVRFINSAPFVSVEDNVRVYTFIHPRELRKYASYLSLGSTVAYWVENMFLYCQTLDETNKLKSKSIRVIAPYENPEEVLGYYDMTSDWQDIVLPFPRDVITSIATELLKNEFGVIPQPDEIKVELNERPT